MKNLKIMGASMLIIALFSTFLSSASVFSKSFKKFSIGYGPLEGEVGYPVIADKDSTGRIVVLDALKSAVIIFDPYLKYLHSFSLSNSIPPNLTNVNLKISNDNFICILINNTIVKYSFDGVLVQSYSFHENRFVLGKSISIFCPLTGDIFSFKDDLTGEVYIASLKNEQEPLVIKKNNQPLLGVTDICSYQNNVCFLVSNPNNSVIPSPNIILFSNQGLFIKETSLVDIAEIDFPSACSFDLVGNLFVFGSNHNYVIFSTNLLLESKIVISNNQFQQDIKFLTAYQNKKVLACVPNHGVFLVSSSDFSPICTVIKKEKKLFNPSSICGNKENLFVFDSILNQIQHYRYDSYQQSFYVDKLNTPYSLQTKVTLFQSNTSSFYTVFQGLETRIKKIDPSTGSSQEIMIPTYISPRSSVYIRSKDNQIYFYSWFDSILYILKENSDLPIKIQVNKVDNSMFTSDCICKIDDNDTIFILLPNLKKLNVFNSSGGLITSFSIDSDGFSYLTSFDFFEDQLVTLNHFNSRLDFFSKRGEKLDSFGKKGSILYPKTEKGYQENSDQMLFPLSLTCIQNKIAVTDSGNSRISFFESDPLLQKIVIELQIGSKSAYINQKRVDLEVPPFTENGRTLVPFRFIGEALGAKVTWFQEDKKAWYELNNVKVEISIGSLIAVVDGKEIKLDTAPKIASGRTFVPIRFVSEALGASVIWEASTKKILITYPGN